MNETLRNRIASKMASLLDGLTPKRAAFIQRLVRELAATQTDAGLAEVERQIEAEIGALPDMGGLY